QLHLGGEVVVQRHRGRAEPRRHGAHRERVVALRLADRLRRVEDHVARQRPPRPARPLRGRAAPRARLASGLCPPLFDGRGPGCGWLHSCLTRAHVHRTLSLVTYTVHQVSDMTSFTRWLPTFLGFPIGGLLAIETVGSVTGPLTAAAAGLLAGAAVGAPPGGPPEKGWRWAAYTALATAAGSALGVALTGAGHGLADVLVLGAVTGTAVGAAQSALLGRARLAWTAVTAAAWALGWLATYETIVDIERGY